MHPPYAPRQWQELKTRAWQPTEGHKNMANRPALFTKADLRRFAGVAEECGKTVAVRPDGTLVMVDVEALPVPRQTKKTEKGPRQWSR